MKKLTIVPAVVLLGSTAAFAQTFNTPSVQNMLSSSLYGSGQHQLRAPESPWTDISANLDYTYGRQDSKLVGGADINSHLVTPSFYLEYQKNLSITASFDYEHVNSDNTPTTLKGNAYGPAISVSYEILHLLPGFINTNITSLSVGPDFGYTRANATAESGPLSATANSDNYDIGASALFIQKLMLSEDKSYTKLALSLAPSYNHEISHTTGAGSVNGHFDFVSFGARLDYGITPQWFVGVYGTWNHYLRQDLGGLADEAPNWATVGAQVVYKYSANWVFKAGYFYDAFNTQYDSHNVNVRAEYHF